MEGLRGRQTEDYIWVLKSFLWRMQVGEREQESMSVVAQAGRGYHGDGEKLLGAEWLVWMRRGPAHLPSI